MKTREEIDLDNMALSAELARQICHEFSNFLYNLMLQSEISKTGPADVNEEFWPSIQRDCQKITRSLQEWDHFHGRFVLAETVVDVRQAIEQVARDLALENRDVKVAPAQMPGPISITASALDCRHLLRLVAEDLFDSKEGVSSVSVELATSDHAAIVRLRAARETLEEEAPGGEVPTLMASACRSLAIRVGATIQREASGIVSVSFPLS